MKPGGSGLRRKLRLESNREPLYKRLPTHDADGNTLSDFMMLIPGLRNRPGATLELRLEGLHRLLDEHQDVVFADLNLPLNLLWVSVRSRHGIINELAASIRLQLPEARLVGHPALALPSSPRARAGGGRRLPGRKWRFLARG